MFKKILIIIGLISTLGFAQPQSYNFFAPTPPPINNAFANIVGGIGNNTYYYWVVARYPVGNSAPFGPILVTNAPGTLTGGNFITVGWNPQLNASSYDLIRLATPTLSSSCVACLVASATVATSVNDNGGGLLNYTVTTAGAANANILLDNQTLTNPTMIFQGVDKYLVRGSLTCTGSPCGTGGGISTGVCAISFLAGVMTFPNASTCNGGNPGNVYTLTLTTNVTSVSPATNPAGLTIGQTYYTIITQPVGGNITIAAGPSNFIGFPTSTLTLAGNAITNYTCVWNGTTCNSVSTSTTAGYDNISATTFALLATATCPATNLPISTWVSDATTNTLGASVTVGGGANLVGISCFAPGGNWIVTTSPAASGGVATDTTPSYFPFGQNTTGASLNTVASTLYVWKLDAVGVSKAVQKILANIGGAGHYAYAVYSFNGATSALLTTSSVNNACGGCNQNTDLAFTFVAGVSYYFALSADGVIGFTAAVGTLSNLNGAGSTITPVLGGTCTNPVNWVAGVPTFPPTTGAITSAAIDFIWFGLTY